MRILDIRETAIPLKSDLTNSSFDFTEMTTSIVAVITDVVRDGKPVTGFAFNSTGRYACGAQMRERFIPRILRADPASLLDDTGNIDPARVLAVMCRREKIGGDAERSIAIGTIEVAVWDAVAKIARRAAPPPARRPLQRRPGAGESVLLCRRRLVPAGADHRRSPGRDAPPSRCRLHHGQDEGRRPAASPRTAGASRRCSKVLGNEARLAVDANGKFARDEALAYAKALRPFGLKWFEEPCHPLDYALYAEIAAAYDAPLATGENLYSTQDVENLVRFGGLTCGPRFHPGRSAPGLRHRAIRRDRCDAGGPGLEPRAAVSPRR